MPEERICTVVYKCAKDHANGFTFGEKPKGYPNFDRKIEIIAPQFFEDASQTIEAYCEMCRTRVLQTRIGPQPE